MRKCVFALTVLLAACSKGAEDHASKANARQQIDSMVGARMEELNARAMEDLDRRMSIEVKVKADSIVAARLKMDTTSVQP